jgi:hypothetical protein
MALIINTVDELQRYLNGVSGRAIHHAPNVNAVILALAGAVILFKDSGTQLEVRTYRGTPANVLYLTLNGTRYVLTYNHEQQSVEIRRNNVRGDVVGSFTNATPPGQILQIFQDL